MVLDSGDWVMVTEHEKRTDSNHKKGVWIQGKPLDEVVEEINLLLGKWRTNPTEEGLIEICEKIFHLLAVVDAISLFKPDTAGQTGYSKGLSATLDFTTSSVVKLLQSKMEKFGYFFHPNAPNFCNAHGEVPSDCVRDSYMTLEEQGQTNLDEIYINACIAKGEFINPYERPFKRRQRSVTFPDPKEAIDYDLKLNLMKVKYLQLDFMNPYKIISTLYGHVINCENAV